MSAPFEQIISSYGVRVRILAPNKDLLDRAVDVADGALLGVNLHHDSNPVDCILTIERTLSGTYSLKQNGVRLASGRSAFKFFKFFDAIVRVSVGELAPKYVFLHAGAVAWRGRAIILPADSFKGKTTLVSELVRNGAQYLSDEFAIIDEHAMVHPFARVLTMRTREVPAREYNVTVDELGGTQAVGPSPIGAIILTGFRDGSRWRPTILSPGQGVMEMLPFALSIPKRPEFTIRVLNKLASSAIIASGSRGNAENFASTLLNFVDKRLN